jgi:hypothetical protein
MLLLGQVHLNETPSALVSQVPLFKQGDERQPLSYFDSQKVP